MSKPFRSFTCDRFAKVRCSAKGNGRKVTSGIPEPPTLSRSLSICARNTGNSARSIIAEAILNKIGAGKFRAYSAGSQPKAEINPQTMQLLQSIGYDTSGFFSKSWDEFASA